MMNIINDSINFMIGYVTNVSLMDRPYSAILLCTVRVETPIICDMCGTEN